MINTAHNKKEKWYEAELPTYADSEGNEQPDYWTVAKKYCEVEGGHLPSRAELITIGRVLYGDSNVTTGNHGLTMKNKTAVFSALGLDSSIEAFDLWSGNSKGSDRAYRCFFRQGYTSCVDYSRNISGWRAICVE